MAKNSLVNKQNPNSLSISSFMSLPDVKKKITEVAGARAETFISGVVSAVSTNPALNECDRGTIVSAALLGNSLKLSPSPQLGHYYLVPFNDRKNNRKTAQFQLGYKGYIQLAMRSGQYKDIDVIEVKEGELVSYSRFNGSATFDEIEDDQLRESKATIGYYAYFELLNGFRKQLYWTREKMQAHAEQYSQGYANDLKKGTNWTFWSKDFDGMAKKTMLRQLLSKWGILSIEMQTAYESDMGEIREDGSVEYVDNQPTYEADYEETPQEEPTSQIMEEPQSLEDMIFGGDYE